MLRLNHPNILPLIGTTVLSDTDLRLITPYKSNRSLAQHIPTLQRDLVVHVIRQIAYGIEYLHTNQIIHCDLKVREANVKDMAFVCTHYGLVGGECVTG